MAFSSGATLNVQAEDAIKEWRATPDTMRVDFRACCVDPLNRGATLMNGARVHALLYSIIRSGFSERKAQTGIVVDIAPDRQADVVAHNARIVQGDPLLPEGSGVMPLFTVLHTNHFVMIGRCFYAGSPTTSQNQELGIATPDGRLSLDLLKNIDRAFYDYLTQGHHVVRLRPGIQDHPELVRAIISSCNHDLGMGETEAQLFVSAKELGSWQRCGRGNHRRGPEGAIPASSASLRANRRFRGQVRVRRQRSLRQRPYHVSLPARRCREVQE